MAIRYRQDELSCTWSDVHLQPPQINALVAKLSECVFKGVRVPFTTPVDIVASQRAAVFKAAFALRALRWLCHQSRT
jgi:hypothetical protein